MRKNAGYRLDEAICVYDLADRLGIEVSFTDIPSHGGHVVLCIPDPVIIVIIAPAAWARRSFTCAHELGHVQLRAWDQP